MNDFKTWVSTNKVPAAGGALFLFLLLLLGWFCFNSWNGLTEKLDAYAKCRTELESLYKQKPFPDQANLLKLQDSVKKESGDLESLRKQLVRYSVTAVGDLEKLFKEKPQDGPQYFQDKLRESVGSIKNEATASNSKISKDFYLGMNNFRDALPLPDETLALGRELTVLRWIAKRIVSQKGTELLEFDRIGSDNGAKTEPSPAPKKPVNGATKAQQGAMTPELLGTLKLRFNTNQSGFREFINSISTAPYFLVIDSMQVLNSKPKSPLKDAPPETTPTADGIAPSQHLEVVFGGESLNVSLRIRMLDFPSAKSSEFTK